MKQSKSIIKNDLKKAPLTGNWRYMKPEVDPERCIGCGTCVGFCPEATISLEESKSKEKESKKGTGKIATIDHDYCKGCGVCSAVCPVKAILMKKLSEKNQ